MYVATACVEGVNWRGTTKWYASDNMNTYGWIRDRYSSNPITQFLLHCFNVAEATWGFDSYCVYI